jgi:hypothetical protein
MNFCLTDTSKETSTNKLAKGVQLTFRKNPPSTAQQWKRTYKPSSSTITAWSPMSSPTSYLALGTDPGALVLETTRGDKAYWTVTEWAVPTSSDGTAITPSYNTASLTLPQLPSKLPTPFGWFVASAALYESVDYTTTIAITYSDGTTYQNKVIGWYVNKVTPKYTTSLLNSGYVWLYYVDPRAMFYCNEKTLGLSIGSKTPTSIKVLAGGPCEFCTTSAACWTCSNLWWSLGWSPNMAGILAPVFKLKAASLDSNNQLTIVVECSVPQLVITNANLKARYSVGNEITPTNTVVTSDVITLVKISHDRTMTYTMPVTSSPPTEVTLVWRELVQNSKTTFSDKHTLRIPLSGTMSTVPYTVKAIEVGKDAFATDSKTALTGRCSFYIPFNATINHVRLHGIDPPSVDLLCEMNIHYDVTIATDNLSVVYVEPRLHAKGMADLKTFRVWVQYTTITGEHWQKESPIFTVAQLPSLLTISAAVHTLNYLEFTLAINCKRKMVDTILNVPLDHKGDVFKVGTVIQEFITLQTLDIKDENNDDRQFKLQLRFRNKTWANIYPTYYWGCLYTVGGLTPIAQTHYAIPFPFNLQAKYAIYSSEGNKLLQPKCVDNICLLTMDPTTVACVAEFVPHPDILGQFSLKVGIQAVQTIQHRDKKNVVVSTTYVQYLKDPFFLFSADIVRNTVEGSAYILGAGNTVYTLADAVQQNGSSAPTFNLRHIIDNKFLPTDAVTFNMIPMIL